MTPTSPKRESGESAALPGPLPHRFYEHNDSVWVFERLESIGTVSWRGSTFPGSYGDFSSAIVSRSLWQSVYFVDQVLIDDNQTQVLVSLYDSEFPARIAWLDWVVSLPRENDAQIEARAISDFLDRSYQRFGLHKVFIEVDDSTYKSFGLASHAILTTEAHLRRHIRHSDGREDAWICSIELPISGEFIL